MAESTSITRIGTAAIEVIEEFRCHQIGWGDCFLLDEVWSRAGVKWKEPLHPLDRHNRVLNTLARDRRFEKRYFRAHANTVGRGSGERLMRYFVVKEDQ